MSTPFLLEIGVEEIPDWMIVPALDNVRELFEKVLESNRLTGEVKWNEATPRRLALLAEGLPERQEDRTEVVSGPAKGAPQKALEGFARKAGIPIEQLELKTTERGEYYTYTKTVPGRLTIDILSEGLPQIIGDIYFPKAMYWTGKGGPRFIRPIRWIVALFGESAVPFEFAGVRSGNVTSGHRVLGSQEVPVTIENYREQLQANGVILSAAARRERIESGLDASVRKDDALLHTLTYLTEYPTVIRGEFDPKFLELPQEILTTVMRHHQRYFSVENASSELEPVFCAVMNIDADPEGLVRHGNERVLRARFNDARFFWETDQKRSLEERVGDLANVTFQAKLGTYLEKTDRNVRLAREIAERLVVSPAPVERAARLLKADLTTEMVKEFTELQGVVGGLYARALGEPQEVWRAIYDHYKPESMEDSIPSTPAGLVVALADKLDTLRGCFAVGLVPTGSKDPFALRRAAQGVVKILVEGKLRLPFEYLHGGDEQLREFLTDRIRYYFRDVRGFAYDEVNAVLSAGLSDLVDAEQRLAAIQAVRPTENFEPLAASFKRIANILRQAKEQPDGEPDTKLLEQGPEADLHAEFVKVRELVAAHRAKQEYGPALERIASMRPKVDLFFDKVMVNVEDATIRRNRLALLSNLLTEFSSVAHFSEIVTSH
ncbi:MAG TPA: glycine--tRNA ligase subunit beta [Bryobacteraceae bacterium]|nr:glycine--tRNA ligase subunit beta [Bryobacteraceae bacterium]